MNKVNHRMTKQKVIKIIITIIHHSGKHACVNYLYNSNILKCENFITKFQLYLHELNYIK